MRHSPTAAKSFREFAFRTSRCIRERRTIAAEVSTMNTTSAQRHEAIVIGAGQAGLAAAYHLANRGIDFVVLEANDRVGDNWRTRYDSLRLYSPAKYDGLPGLRFPLAGHRFPTGREMGDYLESYVSHHGLPVRTGMRVDRLEPADGGDGYGDGYVVTASGQTFEAPQVVIAPGFFRQPHVPPFARELDTSIRQVHSSEYRAPEELTDGPVLVVGLSHSGADMAMEAVLNGHRTIVSGKGHGQLPFSVDSRAGRAAWPVMKFVALNFLTLRTPIGRKMAPRIRAGGAPLLRHRRPELLKAGVELLDERVTGVSDGKPELADGRILDVTNVIWCTGFRPDYGWIQLPIFDEQGFPEQDRGVVRSAPDVYFVGVPFQSGFTSMLVLGASRDAAFVADRVAARAAERPGSTRSATQPVHP
jgi:putative flavoprotein involved in K+ transport